MLFFKSYLIFSEKLPDHLIPHPVKLFVQGEDFQRSTGGAKQLFSIELAVQIQLSLIHILAIGVIGRVYLFPTILGTDGNASAESVFIEMCIRDSR